MEGHCEGGEHAGCASCRALETKNASLREQVEARDRRIASLSAKLEVEQRAGKRQAAPFSKGEPKAAPARPGRKSGDAYGKWSRRPIPAEADEHYDAKLDGCCLRCGGGDIEETSVQDQYQEDIPEVRPLYRHFRVHVGRCLGCGKRAQGHHALQTSDALGAANVHLGPRALAFAAELQKGLGLPYRKVTHVLEVAFALSLTAGGLCQALQRVARALAPTYEAAVATVRQAAVVTVDETGWRVGGHLQWLWVFVTDNVTVYRILDGRGFEEACTVLPPDFDGTIVRDGWSVYRRFLKADHQSCLAHLLRRCHDMLDTAERGAARLPHAVRRVLQGALVLRDHWLEQPPSDHGRAVHAGRVQARLDRVLEWSGTDDENRKLVKHLRNEREAILTFLRVPGVEATNWRAEQAVRPAVVTRKVWGGNRTADGARTQYILATVLQTIRQRGANLYRIIDQALRPRQPGATVSLFLPAGP